MSRQVFDRLLFYAGLLVLGSFVLAAGFGTVKRTQGQPLLVAEGRVAAPTRPPATPAGGVDEPRATATATPSPRATRRPTRTRTITPSPTPTLTPRPTRTPRPTLSPTPEATATPVSSPTPTESPTPRPSPTRITPPTPVATAHDWLERPIAPPGDDHVAHFYPYGGTAGNTLQIHHGVEMVNPEGTQVIAAADGTVVFARPDDSTTVGPTTSFYGNVVVVRLDRQWLGKDVYNLYAHLASIQVSEGQPVRTGDKIGLVGMSGIAMGPHLHFEVRVGGNSYETSRNPELWLKPHSGNGTIAGRVVDEQGRLVPLALVTVQRPDERIFRTATSYPATEVNPDEELQENLVIGDIPAGRWVVAARIGDRTAVDEITVREGETAWVYLQPRP